MKNKGKIFSHTSVCELKIALPGPPQTSKMESFATIVNGFWLSILMFAGVLATLSYWLAQSSELSLKNLKKREFVAS